MCAELFLTAKRFSTIFTPLHFVYFHVPSQILFCIEFLVKDGMNGARLSCVPSLSSEQVFCCKLYTGSFHHLSPCCAAAPRDQRLCSRQKKAAPFNFCRFVHIYNAHSSHCGEKSQMCNLSVRNHQKIRGALF